MKDCPYLRALPAVHEQCVWPRELGPRCRTSACGVLLLEAEITSYRDVSHINELYGLVTKHETCIETAPKNLIVSCTQGVIITMTSTNTTTAEPRRVAIVTDAAVSPASERPDTREGKGPID